MAKVVLASKRFARDYPQFLRKYTDLETTFRSFLQFRETARPDQGYNSKDGRIVATKFRRVHLIHGKAILIYQLHASELRLISLDEHNIIEGGAANTRVRNYAKSLTMEDYYRFDIDAPLKPTGVPMIDASLSEPVVTESVTESVQEPPIVQPVAEPAANPLLNSKVVQYLRGQQLLYRPRPAHPMIVLRLTKELIAPQGDALVIDTVTHEIHHLTQNELDAHFQPDTQVVTSLSEAVATVMPKRAPEPKTMEPAKHMSVRTSVAPQLGRLVVTMAYMQIKLKTSKFDTPTVARHMPDRDRRSVSPLLVSAQNSGLVKRAGSKPEGRGYYYSLTSTGERTAQELGDAPFKVINLTAPIDFRRASR